MRNILQSYDPNILLKGGSFTPFSSFMAGQQAGLARRQARQQIEAEDERVAQNEALMGLDINDPDFLAKASNIAPDITRKLIEGQLAQQLATRKGQFAPPKLQKDVDSEGFFLKFNPGTGGMERVLDKEGNPIKASSGVGEFDDGTHIILYNRRTGEEISRRLKTIPPEQKPEFKGEQARAVKEAEEEVTGEIASRKRKDAENFLKEELKYESKIGDLDTFASLAEELAEDPDLAGAVGIGRMVSKLPSSDYAGLLADLDRLMALGALDTMAKMKNESATGATGFGSMQKNELKILMDAKSILSHRNVKPSKMIEELKRVAKVTRDYQARIRGYRRKVEQLKPEMLKDETPEQQATPKIDFESMNDEELKQWLIDNPSPKK